MACETWTEKLDAYLDGELPAAEARALAEHLRGCPTCAAESLSRVQQKLAVQAAGKRFTPDPTFRARIQASIAARRPTRWSRLWFPALAAVIVLVIAAMLPLTLNRDRRGEQRLMSELADLHVATLASSNPVDVVSSDRHTVKPWFQGKLPFAFNLPEFQGTPYKLLGGKLIYSGQNPGAELLFAFGRHQISVFIVQNQPDVFPFNPSNSTSEHGFSVESWTESHLRYSVIGDTAPGDIHALSEMLRTADHQ